MCYGVIIISVCLLFPGNVFADAVTTDAWQQTEQGLRSSHKMDLPEKDPVGGFEEEYRMLWEDAPTWLKRKHINDKNYEKYLREQEALEQKRKMEQRIFEQQRRYAEQQLENRLRQREQREKEIKSDIERRQRKLENLFNRPKK